MTSFNARTVFWVVAALTCTSCTTLYEQEDDAAIRSRCPPSRALLGEHVKVKGGLTSALLSGGQDIYVGPTEISGDQTVRVFDVDAVCRAWVAGAVSGPDYARYVLSVGAARAAQLKGDQSKEILKTISSYLSQQSLVGLLPPEKNFNEKINVLFQQYSTYNDQQMHALVAQIVATIPRNVRVRYSENTSDPSSEQGKLEARINDVDSRLDSIAQKISEKSNDVNLKIDELEIQAIKTNELPHDLHLYFRTNIFRLDPEKDYGELQRLTAFIDANRKSNTYFYVDGFADPRGKEARNATLSRDRAKFVSSYLIKAGLSVKQCVGRGVTSPEGGPKARARVVIVSQVVPKPGEIVLTDPAKQCG